jgi:hypothetical protein
VYGRFGLRFPSETRKRAFEILSSRQDFRYEGSLFRYEGGPDKVPYKDLGDVCAALVRDDERRERIARGARDYFDAYLQRRQLGSYYLSEICDALEQSARLSA